jgi:hypothetical protein
MLGQNPERYSRSADGEEVVVSASPAVAPLRIPLSEPFPLIPLLQADGIIVECAGRYLVSPRTAAELGAARQAGDPHYWYRPNGPIEVGGSSVTLGRSVPIIRVDISGLQAIGEAQAFVLRTAGVSEVDWSYDDPGPIPEGVLAQINWTIAQSAPRPADRWRLSGLATGADYSYDTLEIAPPGEGGRIDYAAIGEIVSRVGARLADLREDFNRIGDIYFDGVLPEGATESDLIVSAITEVPPAQGPDPERQRVKKTTRVVDYTPVGEGEVSAIATGVATGTTPPAPAEPVGGDNPPQTGPRRLNPLTPLIGLLTGRRGR